MSQQLLNRLAQARWIVLFVVLGIPLSAMAGEDVNEDYTLTIELTEPAFEGRTLTADVYFTNHGSNAVGVQGGICADSDNVDIERDDIDDSDVQELDTTFTALAVTDDSNDWNFGILMNVCTADSCTLQGDGMVHDLYVATYTVASEVVGGRNDDEECEAGDLDTVELSWCTLGVPPIPPAVIVSGSDVSPVREDATVCIRPEPEDPILRGDCNDDGRVNIADAIFQLSELFRDGPRNNCFEVCDTNDDGLYGIADALYCLDYRFLNGPEPPAPFPDCDVTGEDPHPDCELPLDACGQWSTDS